MFCQKAGNYGEGLRRRFLSFIFAMSIASLMAFFMLVGSAMFLEAMSKAVPWAGEVLIMGRPIVTFTAWLKARSFTGMRP